MEILRATDRHIRLEQCLRADFRRAVRLALDQRIEMLVERARRRVLALVRIRGEAAWSAALGKPTTAQPPV